MKARSLYVAIVVAGAICLSASWASAQDGPGKSIGLFTAAQGDVTVTHPGTYRVEPVNVHDEVLFKDVIETQHESRTKAFFEDDSILTIGEHSKVEITEYIYNPDQKVRRTVVKLLQGHLRALVSKVFTGSGSKFEIHTPTAVAAARGTYFVVWFENGMSGIANIGDHGRVGFTSGGTELIVDPGSFSTAVAGGVPAQPQAISTGLPGSEQGALSVEEKIHKTVGEENKAAEKVQQTEEHVAQKTPQTEEEAAKKRVRRVDRKNGSEIFERAEQRETEKHDRAKGTIDNERGAILAKVMKAVEGTVLKDTPKRETPKEAIRASHHAMHVTPLAPAIAKRSSGTNQTASREPVNDESDTTKPRKRVSDESDITKRKSTQGDNETATATAMIEGSPTTSVVSSTGAVPARPNVNAAPTAVIPAAPAAPAVAVVPVAPVIVVAPAVPAVAVVPAAPIIPVPTPMPVAPAVKVAPVTPPAVISGAIDHINRERESRNREHHNRGKK